MEKWVAAIAVAAASVGFVAAETVTFEGDDGIRVIRWIDFFGSVSVETVTDSDVEMMECVAMGADGEPIASGAGFPGSMIFSEIEVDLIASVVCRQM